MEHAELAKMTAAFMEQLDRDQPVDASVGDLVIVAEIRRPDGGSSYTTISNAGKRPHALRGLLAQATETM